MPVTLNTTGITFSNGTSQSSAYTTGLGDIGSYAILWYALSLSGIINSGYYGVLASGSTIAGSSLRRSSVATNANINSFSAPVSAPFISPFAVGYQTAGYRSSGIPTFVTTSTTAMSGTWRLMGGNAYGCEDGGGGYYWIPLLWVRIS